jgi:hypothetical protein
MDFEAELQSLFSRIEPLEQFIHSFAASLPQPLHYYSGKVHHGFRYGKPDVRHFCLVKGVRVISALNAALELARSGFTQEIGVLMRTVVECTTHIEFVLSGSHETGILRPEADKYVQAFFADYVRGEAADVKKAQVRQGLVHEILGDELDSIVEESGRSAEYRDSRAAKLFSNVYLIFSNYVHAKYPEAMDLYGGTPGHFHLRGMKGTPKDAENLQTLDTFITTASNTVRLMVNYLRLHNLVNSDPKLADWFSSK